MIYFLTWNCDKKQKPKQQDTKDTRQVTSVFQEGQAQEEPQAGPSGGTRSGHCHRRFLKTFLLDYDNIS